MRASAFASSSASFCSRKADRRTSTALLFMVNFGIDPALEGLEVPPSKELGPGQFRPRLDHRLVQVVVQPEHRTSLGADADEQEKQQLHHLSSQ